jgi:hypothetical protein
LLTSHPIWKVPAGIRISSVVSAPGTDVDVQVAVGMGVGVNVAVGVAVGTGV